MEMLLEACVLVALGKQLVLQVAVRLLQHLVLVCQVSGFAPMLVNVLDHLL